MVSWAADGTLAGYDGVEERLSPDAYKFATPGTVNVNAITRLHYALPSYSEATYPNRLSMTATLTFTPTDFATHAGQLSVCAYIAPDSLFPPGDVPTPLSILQLGTRLQQFPATWYVTAPQTRTFEIPGPPPGTLTPNTRYWVLLIPTVSGDGTIEVPMSGPGYDPNVIGRALSFWTNRTPSPPTIVAPSTGSTVAPGDQIQLTYAPNDPDASAPSDPARLNADLAGVQVQYAPMPTLDQPNPTWRDLPLFTLQNTETIAGFIRGQSDWIQVDGRDRLIDDLGFPILCGSNVSAPGTGALPSGQWQVRCRTFEYGHPYPGAVNPLGLPAGNYRVNSYPEVNTSRWSVPIRINVPAQVAPPILMSPTDSVAVPEGQTVRLSWQYRNTFRPPFPQARRTVQIRKVGDPEWSTIFNGPSSDAFVDLPPSITGSGAAPAQYLTDLSFEDGTLGGWTTQFGGVGETMVNVNNPAEAHTGNRFLETSVTDWPNVEHNFTINPIHDTFRASLWARPLKCFSKAGLSLIWFNGGGSPITGNSIEVLRPGPTATTGLWPGWTLMDTGEFPIPAGAVTGRIVYSGRSRDSIPSTYSGERIDDVSLIGSSSTTTDSFTLSATTCYEWRVQTQDSDGEVSNYSTSALFWVVPAPGSGSEIPVPTGTVEGATLGCGKAIVRIYRRGGLIPVGTLDGLDHVDWERLRDDISKAKVVVKEWGVDCGNLLSQLRPWQHEIVIFRDNGFSVDRVWEGPITAVTYNRDGVTIAAGDVMQYGYRRILKQAMNDSKTGDTVTGRGARVLMNAFAPDDPNVLAYLTVLARTDDARQRRNTPPYSRTAFEEIDDMASNAGLDYTCAGRSILLWGTKSRIGTLPEFRDEDLGNTPIVSVYGMSMANRYVVSNGNGVWGEATRLDDFGNDPANGLVEILSSTWNSDSDAESGTYTQEGTDSQRQSFADSAERSIADRFPAPVVVRVPDNTTLNPSWVGSIQQLVPGVVVPLRSTGTLLQVVQNQKLDSVKAVYNSKGEKITITLSPFARDDNDPAEGEEL